MKKFRSVLSLILALAAVCSVSVSAMAMDTTEQLESDVLMPRVVSETTTQLLSSEPGMEQSRTEEVYEDGTTAVTVLTTIDLPSPRAGVNRRSVNLRKDFYAKSTSVHFARIDASVTFTYDGKKASCVSKSHTLKKYPGKEVTSFLKDQVTGGQTRKVTVEWFIKTKVTDGMGSKDTVYSARTSCDKNGNIDERDMDITS